MDAADLQILASLLRTRRNVALGTVRDGYPYVSLVLVAPEAGFGGFLIHVSRLALHTAALAADGRCGLLVTAPEEFAADPQQLPRLSLQCDAGLIPKDAPEYRAARQAYLAVFPEAEQSFALADFSLYRLVPRSGRFVAGFGKIYKVTLETLRAAAGAA